ncbi:PIN domain-containing protein [Cryobacterium algoritolerans]|uniref:PIN domain-containing protein n=1 Tax=Cryobacterium algoritolerans TaxID=1259184 RepID=A0A4R8WUT7_9MICO|nr:type II toxin-antitoxin system VapC family toxin [Cryobacterium algoritolerans]TFC17384.1 PIN domain-containing protein [Cryobacterium algoritolerans]
MIAFAVTSAIVKLYADEEGSEIIRSLEAMQVSQLCRVEVPAVLWRKIRMNALTQRDAHVLVRAFENDLFGADGPLVPLRISSAILDDAATLVESYGLRAYDAVQLASARTAREIEPDCRSFAAFDDQLRVAAAAEGFQLIPAISIAGRVDA